MRPFLKFEKLSFFIKKLINIVLSQDLYSISVIGFPQRKIITLQCRFFGLAGFYKIVFQRNFREDAVAFIEVTF